MLGLKNKLAVVIGGQGVGRTLPLAKRLYTDSEHSCGISQVMLNADRLFYVAQESKQGVRAFKARYKPALNGRVK